MNEELWVLVMKMALFLMIACLLVFFMITPFTAEWYIMIISVLLNATVFLFIRIVIKKKQHNEKASKEEKHEKE
mgnify:CR=1 FL=1|jgi:thiosulfate reductase cytochrome b subunit